MLCDDEGDRRSQSKRDALSSVAILLRYFSSLGRWESILINANAKDTDRQTRGEESELAYMGVGDPRDPHSTMLRAYVESKVRYFQLSYHVIR